MAKNTPKQHEKISADCPHCGFTQLESAFAKTTFCRKCGEHYSIEKLLLKEVASLRGPSFFHKVGKLLARETTREIACLSCSHPQQVSSVAQSSLCPGCGSYIDLRPFRITGPYGRSIQTQGEVVIAAKGDVSSARVVCRDAVIEGQVRGVFIATGVVRIKTRGKILGTLDGRHVVIDKRGEVEFSRPLRGHCIEINGKLSARILCESQVTINKGGILEGTVYAKAINVEKGGVFSGELFIGQQEVAPAESPRGARQTGLFGDEGWQPA